jgi:aminopeptidase
MDAQGLSRLAEQFVSKATKTAQGDNLLIIQRGVSQSTQELARACHDYALSIGATCTIIDRGSIYVNKILANATPEGLVRLGEEELKLVQPFTTNINICDDHDLERIEGDQTELSKAMNAARNYRTSKARWLVINAPSAEFAAKCGMELPEFEDIYKKVCLLDYSGMARAVVPLKELMDITNHIHVTGPGTDLQLTKRNIKSKPCVGERNIPDGECYTAPEKFSVNGQIAFGPSSYQGKSFSRIDIRYTEGYITAATAGNAAETLELNRILNTDPGARYTGEFAIGFNPYIDRSVGDILFDEKRRESIHIAQGQSYKGVTYNGNDSVVHFDMVHSQSEKDGGGQLWFDGKLIRHNGKFILPELEGLNPENLL